ncbi:MAG: 5'-methylthioadenosine/adenosylhomocysteine nucleosidase [Bacteroidetes bacterium]|nr:5'-methylthioadenosine/adenosylhomocysteine nucleosidase [Bacteroidota bacterium]
MKTRIVGIMGAMPEEIEGVVSLITNCKVLTAGMRTYYSGRINETEVVVVFSRWGKVAAATTVSTLIHEFHITELIFTGVAGAIASKLKIGDVVIGDQLIQHDMDAQPLMERFEIPLLNKTYFEGNQSLSDLASKAIHQIFDSKQLHTIIGNEELSSFGITHPQLYFGEIASGDQFFSGSEQKTNLTNALPDVLCVEMEGAAVAQVCYEHEIPFVIIRTISDAADEQSHIDFPAFIRKISSKYSVAIIKNMLA